MLHRLFAPRLVPADLYTRATKDSGGRLFLELAEGLSRASAADIGRLASSDVAWRAASLVSQSCLQASVLREPIFPKTNFPFIGQTDLVVRGKWLRDSSSTLRTFIAFRIESLGGDTQEVRSRRYWRARADPFEDVWESEVVPLLKSAPTLMAVTLLRKLQDDHPERFPDGMLRTLQRHVRQWRALKVSKYE